MSRKAVMLVVGVVKHCAIYHPETLMQMPGAARHPLKSEYEQTHEREGTDERWLAVPGAILPALILVATASN